MTNTLEKSKLKSNPSKYYRSLFEAVNNDDLQTNHTPFELVKEMCGKLKIKPNDKILVLYNIEFATFLVTEMKVKQSQITIYNNSKDKSHLLKTVGYNVIYQEVFDKNKNITDMKFDVVIGNPPYQRSGNNSSKRAEKLWPEFINKANDILNENGFITMVTPTSWLTGTGNIRKGSYGVMDLFNENNLLSITAGKFFNVGIDTHYWLMQKNKEYKNTQVFLEDGTKYNINLSNKFFPTDLSLLKTSIIEKVFNMEAFEWMPKTGMYNSFRKRGLDNPSNEYNVKTYTRGGNLDDKIYYAYFNKNICPDISNIKKVIIPLSGAENFRPYIDIDKVPVCCDSYVIPLDDNSTIESCISIFYSKLYKFLIQNYRSSGFIQYAIAKKLPKFNTTKVWSDSEIYERVNLTQEEIDYIENAVK